MKKVLPTKWRSKRLVRGSTLRKRQDWNLFEDVKTEFIGYDFLKSESRLVRYRKIKQKNKRLYQLVFDKTPFYAESGTAR